MKSSKSPADKRGREKSERNPVVRENIEAFAIAIIMALILKFFCVEAFKIPTGSMQPTLIGADRNTLIGRTGREIFDRILVNKFIYDLRPPARWDIIVFQYPLDQAKNYIKRLIGLPGETIEIRDGDIYVDGEIARKPRQVQEAMWRRVDAPHPRQPQQNALFEQRDAWKTSEGDVLRTGSQGELLLTAEGSSESIFFDQLIPNDYLHGYDPDYRIETRILDDVYAVGDLALALTARLEKETGGLWLTVIDREDRFRLFLAGQQSATPSHLELESPRVTEGSIPVEVAHSSSEVEPSVRDGRVMLEGLHLVSERDYHIEYTHVDDTLELEIDGELVCRVLLDLPPPEEPPRTRRLRVSDPSEYGKEREIHLHGQSGIEIGVEDNRVSLQNGGLYRDVYYIRESSPLHEEAGCFEVPEDHYFALGDNTQNSKDGRLWETYTYVLQGGRRVRGDFVVNGPDQNPRPIGRQTQFMDVFGEVHVFESSEVVQGPIHEAAPYIPERFILGQAFFVFWPLFSPFRMQFLN